MLTFYIAAKAALRRKKQHEHALEQTQGQIATLEQQINAIESANINRETLAAMERAGKAMASIHGKLTPEKVDETMYAACPPLVLDTGSSRCPFCFCCFICFGPCPLFVIHGFADSFRLCREKLREQNALSDEIVDAMNSVNVGNQVDEVDLDAELEAMQQEDLDERMLKTGTVPVSDEVQRLPAAGDKPSKHSSLLINPVLGAGDTLVGHRANPPYQSRRGRRQYPRTTRRQSSRNSRRRWQCDGVAGMLEF